MLRIYFLTAWRNLKKNRMVSAINILGLTVGLACAVLAIVYSYHELTYEDCHQKADRICRVYISADFGALKWIPSTWGPEGQALKNLFPEIEKNSISRINEGIVRVGDNLFLEKKILFADSNFYSIVTVPFVEGMSRTDPQSIAISEKTAAKFFGRTEALGKTMLITCNGEKFNFTVTGIYKNLPSNTDVQADFIVPILAAKRFPYWKYNEYNSTNYNTMVLLKPGTDVKELNKKIASAFKMPVNIPNPKAFLMPLKKVHLNGNYDNNLGKLLTFLIGGLLVLIISCINYINLTNILFSTRQKEVGIKMVNGAKRRSIFKQLICDTALSTGISFLLAISILQLILPQFNAIMDAHISLAFNSKLVIIMASLFTITVLLSGIYPALKISTSKSIEFFRISGTSFLSRNRSLWVLTTIQFLFAVLFIQVMLVMNKQNNHLSNINTTGFSAENVICINGYEWGDLEKVKAELLKDPSITAVSWGNSIPTVGFNITTEWKEKDNKIPAGQLFTGEDYMKVYHIKMLAGHYFSKDYSADFKDGIVINQKTATALGYTDPIGRLMNVKEKQYRIIGLVDGYMASPPIFSDVPQLILPASKNQSQFLTILIDPRVKDKALKHIQTTLPKFNPNYPVEIKFHLDIAEEMAKSYYAASKLMNTFFIISIITALFGLFGLSVFIAEKNRKEIGIRKVCGATISEIINKLSKGLVIQVVIAICLASPITFMIGQKYLSMFPRHIKLDLLLLGQGGLLALALMLLTVSWQSWRAARKNPIESLRYE